MFRRWRERRAFEKKVDSVYLAIVAQTRLPVFYRQFGVPDTPGGRFELLALHVSLVLRRLVDDEADTAPFAQELFDTLFRDMEQSLREMGVGDMSIGKKVKGLAQGFYGRSAAYDAASGQAEAAMVEAAMVEALNRNLYSSVEGGAVEAPAMAAYIRDQRTHLATVAVDEILQGNITFFEPAAESSGA